MFAKSLNIKSQGVNLARRGPVFVSGMASGAGQGAPTGGAIGSETGRSGETSTLIHGRCMRRMLEKSSEEKGARRSPCAHSIRTHIKKEPPRADQADDPVEAPQEFGAFQAKVFQRAAAPWPRALFVLRSGSGRENGGGRALASGAVKSTGE